MISISGTKLDNFYLTLVFQNISDNQELDMFEKTIALYIFRKTMHHKKWEDNISMYAMKKDTKMSLAKVRASIKTLEDKDIITIIKSVGGHRKDKSKWNTFAISDTIIYQVFDTWEYEKEKLYTDF